MRHIALTFFALATATCLADWRTFDGETSAERPARIVVEAGRIDNPTDFQLHAAGWRVWTRLDVPSGMVALNRQTAYDDATDQFVETADMVDAAAYAAEQEATRAATLDATIGPQVETLCAILAGFGLHMPLDFADALPVMYTACKSGDGDIADAVLAMAIYNGLTSAGHTDRDIYLVAHARGLTTEQQQQGGE